MNSKKAQAADWARLLDGKKFGDSGGNVSGYNPKSGSFYLWSASQKKYFYRIGNRRRDGTPSILFTWCFRAAKKFSNELSAVSYAAEHGIGGVKPYPTADAEGGQ